MGLEPACCAVVYKMAAICLLTSEFTPMWTANLTFPIQFASFLDGIYTSLSQGSK